MKTIATIIATLFISKCAMILLYVVICLVSLVIAIAAIVILWSIFFTTLPKQAIDGLDFSLENDI